MVTRWFSGIALTGICALTGCMPFVQHGPWVREGTSGGIMASAFHARGESGDFPGTAVGFDGSIRGGYVPADSNRVAFSGGAQLSLYALLLGAGGAHFPELLQYFVAGDAYMTGPRSARLASALGVNASLYHVMPYFQLGSRDPRAGGWYSTQSFLFIRDAAFGGGFLWLPSITMVSADGRPRATHFTVGGGVGIDNRQPIGLFMLAAGIQFFRRDARVR